MLNSARLALTPDGTLGVAHNDLAASLQSSFTQSSAAYDIDC